MGRQRRALLDDEMCVRATLTQGIDTGPSRASQMLGGRPMDRLRVDGEGRFQTGDVRMQLSEIGGGWDLTCLKGQDDLDQTGQAH